MYEQNKNLIAIKVRPITEDLKGFIYPIFYYEHDTFIPVSKEDFPNNNLVIVHQNKIRESYYSDIDDRYEDMELFCVSKYYENDNFDENKDNLNFSKYNTNPTYISNYIPKNKYKNCFLLDAEICKDSVIRCFSPFKPTENLYFIRNAGYILGPFKIKSKEKNSDNSYGYYIDLIAEERLQPFTYNTEYNNYSIYKIKENEITFPNINKTKIQIDKYSNDYPWNNTELSYIEDAINFIKNNKGEWIDWSPDDALVSWGIKLVQDKLSQEISFSQRRELIEQIRRIKTTDKEKLSKLIQKFSETEEKDQALNQSIFNFVCKKENIKYLLSTAGEDFINVIEGDISLKQKFGIQDKQKIKKLQKELDNISEEKSKLEKKVDDLNNQQFTNLSNQLTQLKASIDLANNELEEKKEQLHQADIMLEYPAIEMKYIQFRNDAENYSKIVEQKKVEIDRLTEIRDKISQEIPKIKKEYKDEIYKLAPIVKMLNEADFVNEEHDYSFTPKKGKEYSINETINSIYTHFKNQNRVLEKRDIVNYLVSIINNFFIVFYGKPGVGKTSLVQEIANSLGANLNKISVNKGWTSPKDLLGYYNALTGHFIDAETGLRKFIKQADKNNPFECLYITLLDEANLSPLEYYWSNFLSVADDQIKKIKLQSDKAPDEITLFDGLKFIATINMDETTEALSPRIINRSCVFYLPNEYKIPSLDYYFQSDHYPISYQSLRKNFGYENILQNNHNAEKYGQDKLDAIYDLLSKNKSRSTISISARKQKMIRMYIDTMTKIGDNNNDLGYDNSDVLDFAIAQYILPEIRGDGEKYKELLKLLLDEISPYTFSTSILQKIVEEGQENYDNFNFFYI